MGRFFLWVGTLFAVMASHSQEMDKAKLDRYFDALETHDKFMGSVAVSQNGVLIYTRSIGYCDVTVQAKASNKSKYRIGSISKTFTTVLIFKGVEQGKLSLDDPLDSFFPSIPNADKITIKHLLGHRSGIHNITNDELYQTYFTIPKSEAEMIDIITEAGSDFEPGTKSEYSNSNFILLTYILEKNFGKPYGDLLEEYITIPLGLTDTYLGGKIGDQPHECTSYHYENGWMEESETDMSIPVGAGAVVSNPIDIVAFSDALFGGKLIRPKHLELMQTRQDGYGLGLFQFPFHERTSFGHTGGIDGFSSLFGYFADGKISFAMTSNGTQMNNNDIAIAILSAVFNKPYEIPDFKEIEVSQAQLESYSGVYASEGFPLKITITHKDGKLFGQATGQGQFPLTSTGEHRFTFDQAGILMVFQPDGNTMFFEQAGNKFEFTKE